MNQALRLASRATLISAAVFAAFSVHAAVSGVVAGNGYYAGATVCIDANSNGRCDKGEEKTSSDANGKFTLKGKGAVTAEVSAQKLAFRAPAQANTVIGPVSTELVALMEAGHSYKAAAAELSKRVGADVTADPSTNDLLRTESDQLVGRIGAAVEEAGAKGSLPRALKSRLALDDITNVVVIYAENRSFDNVFGRFPGANGLANSKVKQVDRDGSEFQMLPPAFGGMTAPGESPAVSQAQTTNVWPNAPFQIDTSKNEFGYGNVSNKVITRDLYHRFFENIMQINGGASNQYAAWADSGGLVMGYFDGSKTELWQLAKEYTLADNFFAAVYGGSFLNHQYLVCACAPKVPADVVAANKMSLNTLAAPVNGVPQLAPNPNEPASALNGAPSLKTGNIAPLDYFGPGDGYRAVNTMQPPYQPSGNKPVSNNGNDPLYSDPKAGTWVPPQTQTNIGDLLSAKGISWTWYSGGWAAAVANPYPYTNGAFGTSTTIYNVNTFGTSDPYATDFQSHHQPFNYFANLDPVSHAADRAQHLKDRADLMSQAAAGTLPPVAFYKPVGFQNEHPGYASLTLGDADIGNVVRALQASPQWKHMLVVVTYDEFGGQFDHVAPPKGDLLGPGTRIPAVIISPLARKGYVDHTQYDTDSVIRFITHRYSLPVLPGLVARDKALVDNGGKPMGDLTNALK